MQWYIMDSDESSVQWSLMISNDWPYALSIDDALTESQIHNLVTSQKQ